MGGWNLFRLRQLGLDEADERLEVRHETQGGVVSQGAARPRVHIQLCCYMYKALGMMDDP